VAARKKARSASHQRRKKRSVLLPSGRERGLRRVAVMVDQKKGEGRASFAMSEKKKKEKDVFPFFPRMGKTKKFGLGYIFLSSRQEGETNVQPCHRPS